jgi:ABC-type multidrug transport system fused ATPase/permease subunit
MCFLDSYLGVLFPLIVVFLSFTHLVVTNIRRIVKSKRTEYQGFSSGEQGNIAAQHTEIPPSEAEIVDTDDDEALEISVGRLALARTNTKGSIIQVDTPPAQKLSVVLEELAICGLIAVNTIALATDSFGRGGQGRLAAIAGLVIWLYVVILASLRLFLGNTWWSVPQIWNHTAAIYSLQWLFATVLFRSALIHPRSKLSQILVTVEFALTTLLFGVAITTRTGNKTVLLEWEGDIEPSREPLASLFSRVTFSWIDPMLWKAYQQKKLELENVWNLLPKYKAAAILSSYRNFQRNTSLSVHLFKYFKGSLAIQLLYAIGSGFFTFAPTLLLRAIVQYVESTSPKETPVNVLWLYVILLPVSDIARSICEGMALWIGRQMCIQIRAIIIGEIYAKALRRKAAAGKDKALLQEEKKKDTKTHAKNSLIDRLKRRFGLKKDVKPVDEPIVQSASNDKDANKLQDDDQVNIGTVINLMSVDSFKVSETAAYLYMICATFPIQIVLAIGLLFFVLGWSAIPGMVVMVLLIPVNVAFAKGYLSTSAKILAAADKRVNVTNEILQNIRIIKYFAWEERFRGIVNEKRAVELRALRLKFIISAVAGAFYMSVPVLVTFATFFSYTVIEKKPLYPSVAFTTISLFSLLSNPLNQIGFMLVRTQESIVSIQRVQQFLMEPETSKYEQLGPNNVDETGQKVIGFRAATFTWGSQDASSTAFRLLDLNVDFKIGKLNIIVGVTGSGKTSMLMALLGEMTLLDGRVYLPGGRSREDVRPDPETKLTDTIAYVAQSAWLINANIKDNILFAAPYDRQRYKDVIVACALERDLEILNYGDETLIGEKGITLSGGQKQRISLARAVYSNSQHLLLDDCLSAVDSHTSQWIFSNCISGPLMKGRTCILVSHNIQLCVPSSDFVVVMENGRITAQGSAEEMIASGRLGEEIQIQRSRPGSASVSRVPSHVPSNVGAEIVSADDNTKGTVDGDKAKKKGTKKDAMEESKIEGGVKWSVMKLYLSALGSFWFWVIMALLFAAQQFSAVANNLWIREWTNQYTTKETGLLKNQPVLQAQSVVSFLPNYPSSLQIVSRHGLWPGNVKEVTRALSSFFGVNVTFYLGVLAAIGLLEAVVAFFQEAWLFYGSLTASRTIFNRLVESVYRANFRFFDVTPLGQIMNRFSKDIEGIDQEVAQSASIVLYCALGMATTVAMIAYVTPVFLVAGIFISVAYLALATLYVRASRDLKRLDSVTRSPLFQQFGETLTGITTIRAYGEQHRFIRDNLTKINTQSRPFIYLWACNRWLAFRADILGGTVAFFAGALVVVNLGRVDSGAVGLSLNYAISFTDQLLWLVRFYAMYEQNMNSVERIKEYLEVEKEADAITDHRPPENWPTNGSVEFINYSTRYRKDLDQVLRNINFRINPREKVGIVGRTGAGKSSLALAIFRVLEADEGRVEIDNIDISLIGLQDLRQAITIVPQDPTLFTGTIRTNLDPFDKYTDEDIFEALRQVHLIESDEPRNVPQTSTTATTFVLPTIEVPEESEDALESHSSNPPPTTINKNIFLDLESPITESGSNLSQGQRQLLCLARALIKRSSILVMDEATASIDYATDSKIQTTIRELTSTIITIAHRLQTIIDYDRVLVLDKGGIVEYGHPFELIKKENGIFRGMCETSGDYEVLLKSAKRAYRENLLVDVDEETAD